MASWVADLEQGTAARRPDDAGRFGATARASPAQTKTHPPRRPPPFHTDPAPQPVPPRLGGNKSPGKRPRGGAGDAEDATVETRRAVGPSGPTAPSRSAEPKRKETRASARFASIDEEDPRSERAEHQSTRASDARLTDARAATSLWDRVSTAVESCSVALDDAAAATESDAVPDPAAGTPGFGRTSNAAYGAGAKESGARSNVSNATRKKRVTRAAAKIRTARGELRGLRSAFDELRDFATATQAALFRARRTENGVARQLQSTAGYAEETTARLKQTSQAHKQAQMTAKQLGEALDAANAHIADLSARLRSAEAEASEVRAARVVREKAATALERADKAEAANVRHKEAVAKLTADNMVFLMRLKESETELRDARAEADSMRGELEESRGAWFDKARRDVERVVQNAMRRAESADVALEAEIAAGDERARKWAEENARLRAVAAQNESLAETTARAAAALDEAAEAGRLNDLALRDSRRREFDALNAQKAASAAMTAAREEMGVLKQRMAAMAAALEDQKRVSEGLVEKAKTSVKALATQQQINAGVMRLKNDAEWRMLEMRAAFERAGLEPPGIESAEIEPKPSTPRLAGRPGPAERDGGVNHSALSPLPTPNDFGLGTPMPISPGTLARATEEAMRAAGVPARAPVAESVAAALSEYASEFAFEEEKEPEARGRSPAKRSPAKRSPAKPSVVAARAASPPARRARAGLSTTAAPLVANSRHGNVYGATAFAASPRRASRDGKLANEPNRENRSPSPRVKAKGERDDGSASPLLSPTRAEPRASPTKEKASQHLAEAPAWGASPSKGKFRDERAAADAVAEARRASAEWSRAQARSYSSKKSRNEDAPQSPSRRGDATEYLVRNTEAYAPLPSAPPPSATDARRSVDTALSAPVAPFFEEAGDDDDAGGDDVVPEAVFLRAAERRSPAAPGPAEDGGFENGWIGGRPAAGPPRLTARVASRASVATVSDSDDDDDDDDDDGDDGDAPEKKKKRVSAARLGRTRGVLGVEGSGASDDASSEFQTSEFDFGVVAEHEAAMARLLGPSRGGGPIADYGATRRVSPRRRAERLSVHAYGEDDEDGARDETKSAYGGGVSFSNALPRVR